jgi:hypothetical protein
MALDDAKPYSVGSGYRTSPTNCDDPVHGSGPGEIVFRHMSVVQRGVRSRELPPPQPETASVMSHPLMAYNETSRRITQAPRSLYMRFSARETKVWRETKRSPKPVRPFTCPTVWQCHQV